MAITLNEPGVTLNDSRYTLNGAFIGTEPLVGLPMPYASSALAVSVTGSPVLAGTSSTATATSVSNQPRTT